VAGYNSSAQATIWQVDAAQGNVLATNTLSMWPKRAVAVARATIPQFKSRRPDYSSK
jgi:hypothetical protein